MYLTTFFKERFVVVCGDVVSKGGVVLRDAVAFGLNVGIRLIGLKGESDKGREMACLSCMVISDDINDAT